jgi:hypothetical protein
MSVGQEHTMRQGGKATRMTTFSTSSFTSHDSRDSMALEQDCTTASMRLKIRHGQLR